jgi:hypothetical protein
VDYLDSSKYELRPRGAYVHVFEKESGSVTRLIPAGDPSVTRVGDASLQGVADAASPSDFFSGVPYDVGRARYEAHLDGVRALSASRG